MSCVPTSRLAMALVAGAFALAGCGGVRSAFITDPTLTQFGNENRYTVCLRYNARDSGGQYEGSKDRIAIFYGAQINQVRDATKEECGTAVYRPFPELEAMKRLDGKG